MLVSGADSKEGQKLGMWQPQSPEAVDDVLFLRQSLGLSKLRKSQLSVYSRVSRGIVLFKRAGLGRHCRDELVQPEAKGRQGDAG